MVRGGWCVFDKSRARVSGPPHCADDGTQATTHILPPAHDINLSGRPFSSGRRVTVANPHRCGPHARRRALSGILGMPFEHAVSSARVRGADLAPPRRPPASPARRPRTPHACALDTARTLRPPQPPALCPQCRLPSSLSDETSRRDEPQCACGSSGRGLVSFVTRRGARAGEHACRANVGRAPPPPKPKPPAQRRS